MKKSERNHRFAHDHPLTRGQLDEFLTLLTQRAIGPVTWNMIAESGVLTAFLNVIASGACLTNFTTLFERATRGWQRSGIAIGEDEISPEALFAKYAGLPDPTAEPGFWRAAATCGTGRFVVRLRRLFDPNLPPRQAPYEVNMPLEDDFEPAAFCQVLAYAHHMFCSGKPVPTKILVPGCAFRTNARSDVAVVPVVITEFPRGPRYVGYRFSIQKTTSKPTPYIYDPFKSDIPLWIAEAKPNTM